MKRLLAVGLAAGIVASTASAATQLNVRVVSASTETSAVDVLAGEVVNYQVLGQLAEGEGNNQGLALFAFTLSYDCGDLQQASPPTEAQTPGITECLPGNNRGMTNPAGFGGTTDVPNHVGDLVQVGCAFNTILNTIDYAPFPLGLVPLDIGHTETVLAQGQLSIPADATNGQVCTLSISDVIANTILEGEVDDGTHWAVEAVALGGTTTPLAMTVNTSTCAAASSSTPACDGVLPRSAGTVIRVQYPSDPTASIPNIKVKKLVDGADVTSEFTMVAEAGNTLMLTNTGEPLANGTWYGVMDETAGCPSQFDFIVIYGDVDGDGDTDALDANAIWQNRLNPVVDDTVFDIDGDGDVDALDVNAAWNNRDALVPPVPAKPAGHTCP